MKLSRDEDPSHSEYLARRPRRFRDYARTSRYLEMRDGVKIAVDVCLPVGLAGERVPTIMRQTRYFRRFALSPALRLALSESTLDPMNAPMRRLFTSRGYAWVDVDARGSGASFGERPCPWYLDGEVADGAEIAEWISKQPWSNGRVGSTGVSYDGTTADFLAVTAHPAVRAIVPRFSLWDVYTDVAFPGGLHSSYFTRAWETANGALDRNAPGEMVALIYMLQAHGMLEPGLARQIDRPWVKDALSWFFTSALGGVAPVDEDADRRELYRALASHAENFDVHEGAVKMTFRDDSPDNARIQGETIDYFSPHSYADRLGDVAVLSYGGWFDGGYAGAATRRHSALAGRGLDSRLLLGPWVHGGQLDLDPEAPGPRAAFDHSAELLRFFDQHLSPEHAVPSDAARVRYFMMGEGSWRTTSEWPPPEARAFTLWFGEGRKLGSTAARAGEDVFDVDVHVGSGKRSRWRTLLCPFLHADGKGRSRYGYLVYESEPLERDLVVAGSPVLVLALRSSAPDAAVVAYLEDVTPTGEARLLTEGELRTVHATRLVDDGEGPPRVQASYRRADALRLEPSQLATHAIELLPLAAVFRRGHRVRLSLGGADVDHFTTPPGPERITWRVDLAGSKLVLPVLPR